MATADETEIIAQDSKKAFLISDLHLALDDFRLFLSKLGSQTLVQAKRNAILRNKILELKRSINELMLNLTVETTEKGHAVLGAITKISDLLNVLQMKGISRIVFHELNSLSNMLAISLVSMGAKWHIWNSLASSNIIIKILTGIPRISDIPAMSTFATDTPSAQASYKDAWAAIFNSLQFSAAIYNAAIFALYTVNSRDLALWATNSFWYYNLLKSFHETFDWKRFLSDPDLIYFRVRAMQTSFQSLHTLAFTLSRKIGTNRFLDIGTHGLFSFDGDHLPALRDLNNDLRQMTAAAVFKLQELYLQGLIDVNNPPKGSPHVEALYQLLRNTELDEAYYNALSIALEPQNPILSNHWVIHALDLALHHARVSADYWINRAGGKQLVLKSGAGDGLCSIVENIIELLVLKAKWIGSIEVYFQGIQEYDWVFVDAEVSDYPSVFVTQIVAETYLVCHFSVEDRFSHVLTTLNTVKHGIINRSRDIVALTVLESLLGFLVGAATPEIVQEKFAAAVQESILLGGEGQLLKDFELYSGYLIGKMKGDDSVATLPVPLLWRHNDWNKLDKFVWMRPSFEKYYEGLIYLPFNREFDSIVITRR